MQFLIYFPDPGTPILMGIAVCVAVILLTALRFYKSNKARQRPLDIEQAAMNGAAGLVGLSQQLDFLLATIPTTKPLQQIEQELLSKLFSTDLICIADLIAITEDVLVLLCTFTSTEIYSSRGHNEAYPRFYAGNLLLRKNETGDLLLLGEFPENKKHDLLIRELVRTITTALEP